MLVGFYGSGYVDIGLWRADMVARYRRVAQAETTEGDEVKKKRADLIDRITSKIHALIWVAVSIALLIYTDLFKLAVYDSRVNRYSVKYDDAIVWNW